MEDRERHRREAKQVRAGLHRAPHDCALGMPAPRTRPEGWAASHTRGVHPVHLCQRPQPSLLQQLLPLLSPHSLPCEQAALQRACAHPRERSRSLCSSLSGSGAPRLLSCSVASHLDVCISILGIGQQNAATALAACLAQSVASIALSLHAAPSARGCRHPPATTEPLVAAALPVLGS